MAMGSEISKPIVCGVLSSGNGFGNFQTFSPHKYSIKKHSNAWIGYFYHSQCCKCQRILALAIVVKSVN